MARRWRASDVQSRACMNSSTIIAADCRSGQFCCPVMTNHKSRRAASLHWHVRYRALPGAAWASEPSRGVQPKGPACAESPLTALQLGPRTSESGAGPAGTQPSVLVAAGVSGETCGFGPGETLKDRTLNQRTIRRLTSLLTRTGPHCPSRCKLKFTWLYRRRWRARAHSLSLQTPCAAQLCCSQVR